MRGRLIKIAVLIFMVGSLSAATFFISRGTRSIETIAAQVPVSYVEENDPSSLSPPFREFVQFMEQELDSTQNVGAAFTIVHGGEVVFTGTYGVREKGSLKEVDEHTLFRMASVSKGFAGVLASMLEQDGAFSLNDKVVEHYPGFLLKDSVSTAKLSIRNLLSHTSGLVPYAFDNLVEADQDLTTIIERLDEVDISAPPGELYGYQNVMFSMLDPIVRNATGIPYKALLQDKIFNPLGMTDASAGPVYMDRNPNLAYPHVRTKNGYVALQPHEGYYNVLPAAGVNASISDMSKWLIALLGYNPEWMSDTILSNISTPVIYTPLKWQYTRYWKPFRERYYSLGWRIYTYQGRQIVYHGGYIRGYRAEIAFCPSEDVGIAFMQNSPNNLASRCVPTFMDLFLK
ncbi:MAG: serine hydrolase [Bacteroidetes bacterium]|nr:MAG: serine hydrolase [Bacteroidota bacterium]RLD95496.1 MAG: serine hydrolase [Bacteroidota bacterium]